MHVENGYQKLLKLLRKYRKYWMVVHLNRLEDSSCFFGDESLCKLLKVVIGIL